MIAWQVNGERSQPHCIMVNDLGLRFTNEAANYNAFGAAFHVLEVATFRYLNHPCWLVFDQHYLTRRPSPGGTARRSRAETPITTAARAPTTGGGATSTATRSPACTRPAT